MSDQDSPYSDGGWIQWFCSLEDHQFFCEVDNDYIRDAFNLYGLKPKFPHYDDAIEMILSPEAPEEEELEDEKFLELYQEATDLYGIIHARFILSPKGLSMMREKFSLGKFGNCPRVLCDRQNVLPVGMSEELRTSRVKVFCPRCEDIYIPKKKCPDVDGAYFGCSFPQIFLQSFPDITPAPSTVTYIPRIYGFKVAKKKGSKFTDPNKKLAEITYYDEEHLKKIKGNPSGFAPGVDKMTSSTKKDGTGSEEGSKVQLPQQGPGYPTTLYHQQLMAASGGQPVAAKNNTLPKPPGPAAQ